ncbi:MAG: hypothetical protein IT323_20035 [Anaerolineae bacterium]|nr:hypothetical protein [Anaerolineae bacterium]
MFRRLRASLMRRFPWLQAQHPVALRDAHWMQQDPPRFIRRLTNPWTMLGYAAMIHGALFVLSMLVYNMMNPSVSAAMMPVLSPFLTPFGTPLATGMLASVLYWAMLIGICNHASRSIAREREAGTLGVLLLTPFPRHEVMLAKLAVVWRTWMPVLRTLTVIRLVALLIIPIAIASQQTREVSIVQALDVAGVLIFLAQPFAEAFLALGVSALAAMLARDGLWARAGAYAATFLAVGGLNGLTAGWLTFTAPTGALAGLLVPLGHWTPLVATAFPPFGRADYLVQTVALALGLVIIPILLGILALRGVNRRLALAA